MPSPFWFRTICTVSTIRVDGSASFLRQIKRIPDFFSLRVNICVFSVPPFLRPPSMEIITINVNYVFYLVCLIIKHQLKIWRKQDGCSINHNQLLRSTCTATRHNLKVKIKLGLTRRTFHISWSISELRIWQYYILHCILSVYLLIHVVFAYLFKMKIVHAS